MKLLLRSQLGMDVVVTDHHQTDDYMPPALAVLNPHRRDACIPLMGSVRRGAGL